MTVTIASTDAAAIVAHALGDPAHEVCGLLLGQAHRITRVVATANVAGDRTRRFEVDPVALFAELKAERAGGPRVIGHYHSHPSQHGAPSPRDAAMIARVGELWVIVADGRLHAWRTIALDGFAPVDLVLA